MRLLAVSWWWAVFSSPAKTDLYDGRAAARPHWKDHRLPPPLLLLQIPNQPLSNLTPVAGSILRATVGSVENKTRRSCDAGK